MTALNGTRRGSGIEHRGVLANHDAPLAMLLGQNVRWPALGLVYERVAVQPYVAVDSFMVPGSTRCMKAEISSRPGEALAAAGRPDRVRPA
jgi:hypothetical protein